MRAAVLQLNTTADVDRNIEKALSLVDEAAGQGAELLVLPEKFNYLGDSSGVPAISQPVDGEVIKACAEAAARNGVYLVAGSIWEEIPDDARTYNTTVLLGPKGETIAWYRKIHMFDVEVGGEVYRESDDCRPGDGAVVAELENGLRVGLTICYDLRFPELYRAVTLLGAQVITVPAAFTMATGRDHWEVLVRARAIENQVYVVAANQFGTHGPGRESYGRSIIVDPWGVVLARVPDIEGVAVAELDAHRLSSIRARLPALENRASAAYEHVRVVREQSGDTR